jgi:hypothetical protein
MGNIARSNKVSEPSICRRITALAVLTAACLAGQAKTGTAPRTPDGHPDLQGNWSSSTITPLERPRELANKPFFTPQEAAEYEAQTSTTRANGPDLAPGTIVDERVWWERGTKVVQTLRTSLIVDPPDGRVPALTAEAQKKMQEGRAYTRLHPSDTARDRSLQERCIWQPTSGPPMLPGPYNNNYQIVQTPDAVLIFIEMIHEIRVIPIVSASSAPVLPSNVRQWMGDARGHWEGDTLVVDTTHFTDQTRFRGSDENLHLIERFTRQDPDTLMYEFTVDDPTAFTKPWKAELPMKKTAGLIYEFACHEDNRSMSHMLSAARAEEAAQKSGNGESK